MFSTKYCLASPSAGKESKILLRRMEMEPKRLMGSSISGGWVEGGVGFTGAEEDRFLVDFCTSELETTRISLSGNA